MFPLMPFALGLAAGVVAIRLVRSDATRSGLDKAQSTLSSATASGLAAIERASAKVRGRLEVAEEVVEDAPKPAAETRAPRKRASTAVAKSADKPVSRRRAAAKAAPTSPQSDPSQAE